jgi:hypothetical protein
MPMGHFYSPFMVQTDPIRVTAPICTKCKGALNPFSPRNRQTRSWTCIYCNTGNQLTA